ncbi:MAG: type IV toxin-antitoxin system AbiEi family antitoxin domain-containing protein [Actinomycetota bacterium]
MTSGRTLSRREAELVSWLEAERRPSVSLPEVKQTLGWSDSVARNTLSRLAKKGWLRRTALGRYETVLAETGGWSVPNPWAALSTWEQRYYVGLKSAAYEHGLTPDRPGSVQACVPTGAKRPRAWSDVPIVLVYLQTFDSAGVESKTLHGFEVRIASAEKVLADGARLPGRMGGVPGLARVVDRAANGVDWDTLVHLSKTSPRGRVGLRRLAALLEILGREVPEPLADAAAALPGESPLFLGERRAHGAHGERLRRWQVVVNVDPAVIREEVGR